MFSSLIKLVFAASAIILGIAYYNSSDSSLSQIIEEVWSVMSTTADWVIETFNSIFSV